LSRIANRRFLQRARRKRRAVNGSFDVFATDIIVSLQLFAGLAGTLSDVTVTGSATADYFDTLSPVHLALFDAARQITDVETVLGTSGHAYAVGGFVGSTPEPSSGALLALALALSAVARRRLAKSELVDRHGNPS
jgi:hypothetical protein